MATATKSIGKEVSNSSNGKVYSGGQALMECLIAEGVDTIFGYPGGAIMPVYDALYDYMDRIEHILVRHEQGASHAAEGYARSSGRVGVCMATSGPGATNLITGIADAIIDCTPMVAITGQVASALLGTDAFQETDVIGITAPVCKWNYQITSADEIPEIMAKAFYIARAGKPGPVLVDITKDAQVAFMTKKFEYKKVDWLPGYHPRIKPKMEQVEKAAELINSAKKPYILVGHGVLISEAMEEFKALVEKADIPVASTLLGLSALSIEHPNYMGWLGMHGMYAPNVMTDECDVLIAIGMRFDDRVTGDANRFAKQARIVHIEVDPAEIDKIKKAEAPVIGDAKEALQMLLPLIEKRDFTDWKQQFRDLEPAEKEAVNNRDLAGEGKIKMAEVVKMVSDKTNGEACVVVDVGQHQMVTARYYDFKKPHSYIASGGLGTMGFAIPAAFGAKMGAPDRDVIAFIGDGCFQMTIQELGTIAQSGKAVKMIILNNSFLGMVRQWQQLFFDRRYSFVDLQNPDFITIAKGFGIPGHTCEARENLSESIDQLLSSEGSYLLEVIVEKEENVFPMVPAGTSVSEIRLK
ncbi:biosynthetic-type acetolactate synthase large subunit [Jiulongibacter sediminis]|uniref:Acetolactate synthase n=1 Tax=Jiulongibacter sediminis TaxID=1605367 RepID=A0A0P7C1R1_9BACT|nr:biosynthetic-type acetolactate synthase large subunit [Jiulongibacter sediminis]KPM48589.1 acetolactate synthase catalytic subunit [Jiulongibacter sediminis]TBX25127.1 acetolactate synthase catalytic subunit [Jiulongibacter sediminis]